MGRIRTSLSRGHPIGFASLAFLGVLAIYNGIDPTLTGGWAVYGAVLVVLGVALVLVAVTVLIWRMSRQQHHRRGKSRSTPIS